MDPVYSTGQRTSAGEDGKVRLWDLASGRLVFEQSRHTDKPLAVAFGCVGDRLVLASAGMDSAVLLSDARTGEPIGDPLAGHSRPVLALATGNLHGQPILASCSAGEILLWDLAGGRRLGARYPRTSGPLRALALGTIDGHTIMAAGGGEWLGERGKRMFLGVWDLTTEEDVSEDFYGHAKAIYSLTFDNVGDQVILAAAAEDCVAAYHIDASILDYLL